MRRNDAIMAMARFGLSVFERHRNYGDPGDVDGGAAEMDAIQLGLLRWKEDKDGDMQLVETPVLAAVRLVFDPEVGAR